jgi:hypothetical protein
MQDPNEDTEWNDILRKKGILPQKQQDKEISEDDIVDLLEKTVKEKTQSKPLEDMSLDELEELEDEEDERVLLEYRDKRLAEIKAAQLKAKYGSVKEISAQDYVDEVNKAGDGVWVVLHLFKIGLPLCALLNQHLAQLAAKFPATKFLKSISSTCIPNYPDKNLPTIFVYFEGEMKAQFVGPFVFGGMNLTVEDLEWMLAEKGVLKTNLEEDPRKKRKPRNVVSDMMRTGDDSDSD